MPINSKRGKKGFNWGKTQQIPKVKHQEKSSTCLLVSIIKPLVYSKD
jgi:hypothetical protein